MRIRIIKQPQSDVEGVSLSRFRLGQTYDVTGDMANYLVASGFAVFERRGTDEHDGGVAKRKRKTDRS